MGELGVEANTPSELLGQHHVMREQHRHLQLQKTELQQEIHCLRSEQLQLVNAQKLQNGIVNNHRKNGVVRSAETQRILQREVLSAFSTNHRLVLQVSQLEQDIHHLQNINNQLIAADSATAAAAANNNNNNTPASPTPTPTPKTRSGAAKGVKRKSGGTPVESGFVVTYGEGVGKDGGGVGEYVAASEKLKEKLDMKENLNAYSSHIHRLKSEVTAMSNGFTATTGQLAHCSESGSAGSGGHPPVTLTGSVKQEVKFQPPDLSIKGLLEKTRMPPSGPVKNESAVASAAASSIVSVASSSAATVASPAAAVQPAPPVKSEAREVVVNGSKKRKTVNGVVVSQSARTAPSNSSAFLVTHPRQAHPHSSLSGSTSSSSSSSSWSSAGAAVLSSMLAGSQDKKNLPRTWEEQCQAAQQLIHLGDTPLSGHRNLTESSPPASVRGSGGDAAFTSSSSAADQHRQHNNYSPISRPSSQSSAEGADLPSASSSAAAVSRLALQEFSAGGALSSSLGDLLASTAVPLTVTVDLGGMSGGCVSSRPLTGAHAPLQRNLTTVVTQQQGSISSSKAAAAAAAANPGSSLLASTHSLINNSSSRSMQATIAPAPAPSPQGVQKDPRLHQLVIQSVPPSPQHPPTKVRRGGGQEHHPSTIHVEFPLSAINTPPTPPTAIMVQGGAHSGTLSALLHPPTPTLHHPQATVRTQLTPTRPQHRSRGVSQPRVLQPAMPRPQQQQIVTLSATRALPMPLSVPVSQQDVAKILGTSVLTGAPPPLSSCVEGGSVPISVVNGMPQPLRYTTAAMPHPINGRTVLPDVANCSRFPPFTASACQ
ncbi:hypothetical protein ACOMHN_004299 [Nucella lapillus]